MRTYKSLGRSLMLVAVLATLAPIAANAGQVGEPGRVEFDFQNAAPANVEIDLKNGMLSALTDIAVAAVDGATEGLRESGQGDAVRESTEIMGAVREVLGLTSEVVKEVRLRIYEDLEDASSQMAMQKYYQEKLDGNNWDNVVRVREGDESVAVCVHREGSAIRGIFVMVAENDEMVLANVVCSVTPEKVKQLTHKATKIGMRFGLGDAIEQVMREISH